MAPYITPVSHSQSENRFADFSTLDRTLGNANSNKDCPRETLSAAHRSSSLIAKRDALPDTSQAIPDQILDQSTIGSAIETSISKVTVAGEDTAKLIQKVLHFDDLPEWMQTDPYIRHGYRRELKSFRECGRSLFYPHNEFVNTWSHLLPALFFLALLLAADYPVLYGPARVSWSDNLVIQMYVAGTAGCLFLSAFFHGTNAHSEEVARRFLKLDYLGIVLTISTTCMSACYFGLYGRAFLQTLYITLIVVCAAAAFWAVLRQDADGHSAAAWRAAVFIALALSGFMPIAHVALAEGAEGLVRFPLANIAVTCGSYLVGTTFYIHRIPEKHFPGYFDVWGASHQIFHLLVVFGQVVHLQGLISVVLRYC